MSSLHSSRAIPSSAQLAEDHHTLAAAGIHDLDQAALSVRAGTAAASAHARAMQTMRTLAEVDGAFVPIRALVGTDGSPVGLVVQFVDAPDASASELRQYGNRPSHWDVVSEGWVLALASPDEAAARHRRAYDLQAGHQRAAEQARLDAVQARYGHRRTVKA